MYAAEGRAADAVEAIELLGRVEYGRVATSMRALPFLAVARHIVRNGRILLRMHRGFGYHLACQGGVVAYGADSLNHDGDGAWSAQCVGACEAVEPTTDELGLLGPAPRFADGEAFDPVYLRVEPQVGTVHRLEGGSAR
ncbi:pyridoxamine 5'-phosphate oxidase family protein [Streptomyces sp. O3]